MLKQLSELHALCFPDHPWSADDFAELKASGCEIIASDNGFIMWRATGDEAEIITIGVHPDFRRQGVAQTMIILMEQELKKSSSVNYIFLEVNVNNTAALTMYRQAGFESVGARPKYYNGKDDAVIMRKSIG